MGTTAARTGRLDRLGPVVCPAMSSRQDEKERRRREREEQERKAQASASNARRLQLVGGAVLVVAVIVVAVVLLAGGGGDGDDTSTLAAGTEIALPPRQIESLAEAVEAADCTYREVPNEGATHTEDKVTYKNNPPTSGDHNPVPAQDGIYEPGNTPDPEHYVHTLEHGRILFQYQPGAPDRIRQTLEAVFNEEYNGVPGYHAVVMENNTGMKALFGATAWDQELLCDEMSDAAIDALRAFRERFTDQGPEFVP
jgi:hypothetical protein